MTPARTPEEVAQEVLRLAEKATPGPYFPDLDDPGDPISFIMCGKRGDPTMAFQMVEVRGYGAKLPQDDNARFAIAAMNAAPLLARALLVRALIARPAAWTKATDDPGSWPADSADEIIVVGSDGRNFHGFAHGWRGRAQCNRERGFRWLPWPSAAAPAREDEAERLRALLRRADGFIKHQPDCKEERCIGSCDCGCIAVAEDVAAALVRAAAQPRGEP